MTEKISGGFAYLADIASKLWPLLLGLGGLIIWAAQLQYRVDDLQSGQLSAAQITVRVEKLEQEESDLSSGMASLQSQSRDIANALNSLSNSMATVQAQMQIVINQTWPQAKVPTK